MKNSSDLQLQKLAELDAHLKELTSTSMGRRTFIAALPILLSACATVDKTRYREGDNSGQASDLTVDQERQMTSEVLPKMKKDYPPVRDPQLQSYVKKLGAKITAANKLEGAPYNYNFTVVDVPNVNAFALPAGTVFVTAPLMAMADSEAELMGVIGHEIGHIKARHSAERMHKAKKAQKKSWMYSLGGAVAGGLLGYGASKILCKPEDKKCIQKTAELGVAAGVGGGLLIQKYGFMANSREDEMEADRIGFRTSVAAGYHPEHVGRFYKKLLAMEQKSKRGGKVLSSLNDALSTHPPSKERVAQMAELAGQSNNKGLINTKTFNSMRNKARAFATRAQQRVKQNKSS